MDRYPCMVCSKGVTWSRRKSLAMQCEQCDRFTHIDCAKIGDNTYSELANSSNLWLCTDCGLPNHTEFIQTYNVSVHYTYDILNEDCSLVSIQTLTQLSVLIPLCLSLRMHPPRWHTTPQLAQVRRTTRPLKFVTINFRSVVRNRDRLVDPDIILGTAETHLTGDIATPTNFLAMMLSAVIVTLGMAAFSLWLKKPTDGSRV